MFSPYYAWSGWADPLNHCAVNVALYGPSANRWAMTERGRKSLSRDASSLAIGPSHVRWENDGLTVTFDEITAPIPSSLRGTVRLRADALTGRTFMLDAAGRHRWRPIAPRARLEVALESPALRWSGDGYFDTNAGDEPLERAFTSWDWCRAHTADDTLLFYDIERRGGGVANLALRLDGDRLEDIEAPPRVPLPPTFWRVGRTARGEQPVLKATLEDAPFYARSTLADRYDGRPAMVVHETLALARLRSPIVRAMLPFRMPRAFA